MKILCMGDSITDMSRNKEKDFTPSSYGNGYPFFIEGELSTKYPTKHIVINRGISGNRIVDIYARIKSDCWNLQPDLISILIGVNDVWHEIGGRNGVSLERYERFYRMYIEDTLKVLPNVKFMLLEPFVLKGLATEAHFEDFCQVKEYAKVVKKLSEEYNCTFVPLQARFDELAKKYGEGYWLSDGVHPAVAGSKIISEEWLKRFYELI